jgi:hypothetical protein
MLFKKVTADFSDSYETHEYTKFWRWTQYVPPKRWYLPTNPQRRYNLEDQHRRLQRHENLKSRFLTEVLRGFLPSFQANARIAPYIGHKCFRPYHFELVIH